jgi:carbamoyl-phosphate synthase large subunit
VRGKAFVSVRDADKRGVAEVGRELVEQGFEVVATRGTQPRCWLEAAGILRARSTRCRGPPAYRRHDQERRDQPDHQHHRGRQAIADSFTIRREALQHKVSYTTTLAGARWPPCWPWSIWTKNSVSSAGHAQGEPR